MSACSIGIVNHCLSAKWVPRHSPWVAIGISQHAINGKISQSPPLLPSVPEESHCSLGGHPQAICAISRCHLRDLYIISSICAARSLTMYVLRSPCGKNTGEKMDCSLSQRPRRNQSVICFVDAIDWRTVIIFRPSASWEERFKLGQKLGYLGKGHTSMMNSFCLHQPLFGHPNKINLLNPLAKDVTLWHFLDVHIGYMYAVTTSVEFEFEGLPNPVMQSEEEF